ncbi:helix-turn-helix domain-containing protein [Actinophytocola sp.]|uniref:helix-turn-helix domain-containing protein n=1 Tax=Actinophytocola sp. TaxID=1872138 RepID=UPI0039C87C30
MPTTPTRRKRRLGQLLERLRLDAGLNLRDAAELLRVREPTASRYETGQIRPGWPALQALLGLYGADEAKRAEAAVLWEDAGEPATRVVTPAGSSRAFRAFLRAEAEADTERALSPLVVPGLLQTVAYARAINASGRQFHVSERTERYVTARMNRQVRLTEANPLKLHALIDEAVIRRVIGDTSVMIDQLNHLVQMGKHDNVTIQVVAFRAGAYATMEGAFMIIGYAADDLPVVFVEDAAGGVWVENENDVGQFAAMFDEVTDLALTPEDSAALIASGVRDLEKRK